MTAEERARLERVAIGQICGCRECLCCAEYMADYKYRAASRGGRGKHEPQDYVINAFIQTLTE